MKAKVKQDTLFKLQPVLSSELADSEKQFVPMGSEFELKFFSDAADHHLRLELANPALGRQKGFTWYVPKSDLEIVSAGVTATVLQDTVFKLQPRLSSDLADHEKVFVPVDTQLELQSYAAANSNHMRLTLADARLGNGNSDVWYAIASDIQVSGQKITLKVITDTIFKAKPLLSSQLSASEKEFVPKQTAFGLQTYSEVEGGYLKVILAGSTLGKANQNTWYALSSDVEIEGTEPHDYPNDYNSAGQVTTATAMDSGQPITLPGFHGTYNSNDPIIAGGYFTWAQATHGGTRIPASTEVVYGMIRIAEALEEIRGLFSNRTIEIVSWYRDPATNLRVGGSKSSRHMTGDGVNFVVAGVHPRDVYSRLDEWWGARGGLASCSQFTHIDARGYRARWSYDL